MARPSGKISATPKWLGINIVGGRLEISDYSHGEDADALIILLGTMGAAPQSVRESQCG